MRFTTVHPDADLAAGSQPGQPFRRLAGDERHGHRPRRPAEHHRVAVEESPRAGRLDDQRLDLRLGRGA